MKQYVFCILLAGFCPTCQDSTTTVGDDALVSNLDGTLVFQSNRTGNFEIFSTNSSGTGITNVSQNIFDDIYPTLSFNGAKLAYLSNQEGTRHIYVYQNNTSTKITSADLEYDTPQMSHRGDKIVFIRNYNLFLMNSTGSGTTQLTFDSGDTVNYSPAFSYDDSKLVFTRNTNGGNSDIILMNGLGGATQNMTDGIGDNLYPAFSPDDTQIVFSRNNHISILSIATKSMTDLMPDDSLHFNGYPVFSPNGNTIAFVSNRTGNMDIFTMKTNGQGLKNITENEAIDTRPYWSE